LREWEDREWLRLERNAIVILSAVDLDPLPGATKQVIEPGSVPPEHADYNPD
jgi:hypothetical protein